MKCQILISGEHKKNITKLLSAKLAKSGNGYLPWPKWPKTPLRHFSFHGQIREIFNKIHSSRYSQFVNRDHVYFYYYSTKTYVVVLIRSALLRHFK